MSNNPLPLTEPRRQSTVRFSRGDMSPIGTMASDSTINGPHVHPTPLQFQQEQAAARLRAQAQSPSQSSPARNSYIAASQQPLASIREASPQPPQPRQYLDAAYDGATYPLTSEVSLGPSEAPRSEANSEYYGAPHDETETLAPGDSESVRYAAIADSYTVAPPRVSGRRQTLDMHGAAMDADMMSPRSTTAYGQYDDFIAFDPRQSPARAPQQRHSVTGVDQPLLQASPGGGRAYPYRASESAIPPRVTPSPRNNRVDDLTGGSPYALPDQRYADPRMVSQPDVFSPRTGYGNREERPSLGSLPQYSSPRSSAQNEIPRFYEKQAPWGEPQETTYQRPDWEDDRSGGRGSYARARANSESRGTGMRRRTTREVEADEEDTYRVKGGVFSQLLRLTGQGTSSTMRRRFSSKAGSEAPAPTTMKNLGLKRVDSVASTAWGMEDLDPDDPRLTGVKKKKKQRARSASFSDLLFRKENGHSDTESVSGRRHRRASIQLHVADILTRQQFILKLAKALMTFGAPSHRIESQLAATALVLEIDAQFIHFPSIVICSFGDVDTRTSETHFVKAPSGLELGKLHKTHTIYRQVVHDKIDAAEGTRMLHTLLKRPMEYNLWQRMVLAFFSSALIAPMAFSGSIIDGLASGALAILLSFMQLHVASKSAMYSNIFEISIATVISFTARGLSTTGLFCYQAVASAGVVLILPGYTILCGSLELASKHIVPGSVRMVYAIIYSLFLGFGITIGSDLFYVFDRPARRAADAAIAASSSFITLDGTFSPTQSNASSALAPFLPFNGTFTFSNTTSDAVSGALNQGSIICVRDPNWPWWRQGMPEWYLWFLVPIFSVLLSMWNMQPLRSRQLPVMCVISCIAYFTNTLANHYIFDRSDVVSAIGAFVVGILGNVYSRIFGGTAFTSMVPGVLFLVPSGISAAGGLAMSNTSKHSQAYSQGLTIGFRMIQVGIGITVGLFGSGLLIYSFGRKKGAALFAF